MTRRAPPPAHDLPPARYLFFGGKGGVGKTTAAASAALTLLDRARPGERILLFSTDPAHSLSDSLNVEVGDRLVEVARRGRSANAPSLAAREMDAARALEEFRTRHRGVLAEIADRGTMLDEADINDLLGLSLPGLDEVMALFELSEVDRSGEFARVVVDTAPSGHTTRMLRLPEVFARWVGALDTLSEKHRYMVAQFARGRRAGPDEVELFLRELTERVNRVRAMLTDPERTAFLLVTTPEAMAVEESARYLAALRGTGVPVTDLVINRVERVRAGCRFCRGRARAQTPWLKRIESEFRGLRARRAPLFPAEVRGAAGLRRFARAAWLGEEVEANPGPAERATAARKGSTKIEARLGTRTKARLETKAGRGPGSDDEGFAAGGRRLLVFGGKGGVGKTTAAAAAALAIAQADEGARVLIFSTDPAHSLSDSFAEPVGELKEAVAGRPNLDAKEIDPTAKFEELKERYRLWADELFAAVAGGSRWQVQFDREAMRELVTLAPPGMDEIAALSAIIDLLDEGRHATIVLDTAPTGHLLRFLELPAVALAWVRTFLKLLLKYRNVVRWEGVAEELVALSKNIKRVSELLTDGRQTEFVGVAAPERMSLEETTRLAAALEQLRVPMSRLVINGVTPAEAADGCDFCSARRTTQLRVVREFRSRLPEPIAIYLAPQRPAEVRGARLLRAHYAGWRPLA
ncbi:MAG TPA: ArsA family ATPase [Pyrinomonadaceae bacterium]|nr:ArsA family ATPase [Pyrinomonadaceae bacterium]